MGTAHTSNTVAIRKNLAQQFANAAKALEKDQSKEKLGLAIMAARIGLANAIMPKIHPVKR
jgi:hypothetical protein